MNSFKMPSTLKKAELTLHPLEPSDALKSIRKLEAVTTAKEQENSLPTSNKGNFSCPWAGCKKSFVEKCSVNMHIRKGNNSTILTKSSPFLIEKKSYSVFTPFLQNY